MNTIPCRSMWGLAALVALTGAVLLATDDEATAQNQLSDEMVITGPGGGVIFDVLLPEGPAGGELSVTFPGGIVPPPIPLPAALGLPGISAVVLTEPPGEPPPEPPIVIPGHPDVFVSDVVISTLGVDPALGAPPFITLLSDGSPDLPQLVDLLAALPGLVMLPETGLAQDLTPFLVSPINNPFGPISVFVRSDVQVPEPAGFVLAGLAFVGLAGWARRKTAR